MNDHSAKSKQQPTVAVALKYDGKRAPTLTAKGRGTVAEKILELAEQNGIPLHEDKDLVTLLSRLELGDEIPPALYAAVAEVIAFAYMMTGKVVDLKARYGVTSEKGDATT